MRLCNFYCSRIWITIQAHPYWTFIGNIKISLQFDKKIQQFQSVLFQIAEPFFHQIRMPVAYSLVIFIGCQINIFPGI